MLGLVTCFFNPCGYKRILENYFRFRDALGHDLVTVELSFNGEFEIPDAIHLEGSPQNVMWQKERLLNIGMESLSEDFDKVAWLDADIFFLNPNWYEEAEEKLETHSIIQLFENVNHLDINGHILESQISWVKGKKQGLARGGLAAPGMGWAARRDALPQGLLDTNVVGSGDMEMIDNWYRDFDHYLFKKRKPSWQQSIKDWGEDLSNRQSNYVGHISGDLLHLYHGSRKDRLYVDRHAFLFDHDFDPAIDIVKDENGLWRWNSDKPQMHKDVASYFDLRKEDHIEPANQEYLPSKPTQKRPRRIHPAFSSTRKNIETWSVGVTTAKRKKPTLEQTLDSLTKAGWDEIRLFVEPETNIPFSFQHLPRSQRDDVLGAFPNWYLSLCEMVLRDPQAEAYFLCQDDVLFSEGLRSYLETKLWPSREVGLVSVYCPSHYGNGKPNGFHIEEQGWNSWGALAYIFPNSSARKLLSDPLVLNHRGFGPADGMRNIDSVVGLWCQRAGLPYFVHSPSLAQHIGDTSTIWKNGSNVGRRRASDFQQAINST